VAACEGRYVRMRAAARCCRQNRVFVKVCVQGGGGGGGGPTPPTTKWGLGERAPPPNHSQQELLVGEKLHTRDSTEAKVGLPNCCSERWEGGG
jgi:hypothetical protein